MILNKDKRIAFQVDESEIFCAGHDKQGKELSAAAGHPKVWLKLAAPHYEIDCPYCDARFKLNPLNIGKAGHH